MTRIGDSHPVSHTVSSYNMPGSTPPEPTPYSKTNKIAMDLFANTVQSEKIKHEMTPTKEGNLSYLVQRTDTKNRAEDIAKSMHDFFKCPPLHEANLAQKLISIQKEGIPLNFFQKLTDIEM